MSAIKVLAFEDDSLHAEILQMHVDKLGYHALGIHADTTDAVRLISATRPDVVLMDIEMNGRYEGIAAAQKINSMFNVPLIYLSSLPSQVVLNEVKQTFPEAYLTKPYNECQLQTAIELAIHKYQKELQSPRYSDSYHPSAYLYVKVNNNLVKLCYNDIDYIEAYDKYCFIHTGCKKHLVTAQLKQLQQKLPPNGFLQVHRSFVVNLKAISGIRPAKNMVEINEALIPYSKTYKDGLFNHLNII